MKYDKHYFTSLNYSDYLQRRDQYLKLAFELHELLSKLRLIDRKTTILDYGCAVGFLIEGFKELGYEKVYGFDVSRWAISQAKKKGLKILSKIEKKSFDIIICLDVLEHMADKDIYRVFTLFNSEIIIVRIPCSTDGKRFVLEVSNQDQTHINCKSKKDWVKVIKKLGYQTILPINLLTIYDTSGVMCALCLKSGSRFDNISRNL